MVELIQNNTVEIIIGYMLILGLFIAYNMYIAAEIDENGNIIKNDKNYKIKKK